MSDLPLVIEARLDRISVAVTNGEKADARFQLQWLRKDLLRLFAEVESRKAIFVDRVVAAAIEDSPSIVTSADWFNTDDTSDD